MPELYSLFLLPGILTLGAITVGKGWMLNLTISKIEPGRRTGFLGIYVGLSGVS